MSNYDKLIALGIPVRKQSGSEKTICPKCSHERKKKNDKCMSVDITEGIFNCHNCQYKGTVKKFDKPEKIYIRPVWNNNTQLSEALVKWFTSRGIGQQTLIDVKISEGNEWMPQTRTERNCIKFNYFRNGELINTKFRDGTKNFKLVKDAELILYNLDALDRSGLIITEGEMDCLSFIESGLKSVCSVPNGASKSNNLAYIDNCFDELETVEQFYIAVDNDIPGMALRDELVRRLGSEKCSIVDFRDCKDANEFLQKYGKIELSEILESAKPCEINGIITAESLHGEFVDLYERGLPHGDKIGLREFDDNVSFIGGQLTMITGVPNHGKSDFVDQIIVSLAIHHGWKFGIYSPENFPIQIHLSKLAEKIIGSSFRSNEQYGRMSLQHAEKALEFINDHFFFIQPNDEDMSLDNILEHGKKLVRRYGIKGMVIDPWNKLDHRYTGNETQYISSSLDSIIKFNQRNSVHSFVVAHPTKLQKDKISGMIEIPNLYQISGSAHFYNKCDNGIVVHRFFSEDPDARRTEIHTMKVKFKHLGSQGVATMNYDISNGRYNCKSLKILDKSNWLKKDEIQTELKPNFEFFTDKQETPIPF